jgi:hypothetical protein
MAMKLARSTFVSVGALFFALSLTAAQAGPQTDGMSGGGAPAAGNMGAGDGGPSAGGAGNAPAAQPDGSAGQSGAMSGGPEGAPPKGSAANAPSATGDAKKESKGMAEDKAGTGDAKKDSKGMAEDQTDKRGDGKDGKSAEQKSGAADDRSDKRDGMSEDKKSGATAEGKDESKDKAGKSAKLESKDISRVRSHFSQHKPNVKRIDKNEVSVSIGVALPSAIVLYDLPPDVIVVGGPCPVRYFVWGDDIVLVDACTREVVEIIAGVA